MVRPRHLFQAQAEGDVLKHVQVRNSAYFWNTVFTGRLYGGMLAMSLPSKKTLPDFGVTKPAITRRASFCRSRGARKVTNSLSWMSSESPSRTFCPSNSTTMSFSDTSDFHSFLLHPPLRNFPLQHSLRTVSSLGRHKVLDESASIMPPRKGLLHGYAQSRCSSTYNANVSGQKRFTL